MYTEATYANDLTAVINIMVDCVQYLLLNTPYIGHHTQ